MSPIERITLPASITNIENYAFYHCYNLREVTSLIEEPFVLNSWRPFSGYRDVKKRMWPIEDYFTKITLEDYNYPEPEYTTEDGDYSLAQDITLYVPAGTKEKYIEKGWGVFKEIIEIGSESTAIETPEVVHPSNGNQQETWYTLDGRKQDRKPVRNGIGIVRRADGTVQKIAAER